MGHCRLTGRDEPTRHLFRVSRAGIAELEVLTNLCAMIRDSAPFPIVLAKEHRIHFQLVGDVVNHGSGNLMSGGGETPFKLKAFEQERKAKAGCPGLIPEEFEFGRNQRKMFN